MSAGKRPVRVGEAVREVIAEALTRGLKTPGVGFCTITAVEMSPDLKYAKVFVSVYGDGQEQERTLGALRRATGHLRHEVAKGVRLRVVPELEFRLDASIERGSRLEAAIRSARDSDRELAALRGEPEPAVAPAATREDEEAHGKTASPDAGPDAPRREPP